MPGHGSAPESRLMGEAQLETLRFHLHLPEHVIQYLSVQPANRRRSADLSNTSAEIILTLACIGFFPALSNILAASLEYLGSPPPPQALMRSWLFYPSMLLGFLFGGVVATFASTLLKWRRNGILNAFWMELCCGRPRFVNRLTRLYSAASRGIDRTIPATEFLAALDRNIVFLHLRRVAVFGAIFFTAVFLDVKSITWVTASGVIRSPYFSLQTIELKWSDVANVTVGCKTSRSSRPNVLRGRYRVQYEIRFRDRSVVDLGQMSAIASSEMDALETVSASLRRQGVRFVTGELDRDCLQAKRSELGADYARLERVLGEDQRVRIGPSRVLPGDIQQICERFREERYKGMTYEECVFRMSGGRVRP